MKNRQLLLIFLLLFTLFSCSRIKKEEAIGLYVSRNNVNTIDSVWVMKEGNYINLMYRKKDSSLVYKNIGKWNVSNGYIIFKDFFSDEDDIHSKDVTNYENVLITTKLQLNRKNGKIIIHHKPMYDNIYLEKIE